VYGPTSDEWVLSIILASCCSSDPSTLTHVPNDGVRDITASVTAAASFSLP
jgi:hypothetical protein